MAQRIRKPQQGGNPESIIPKLDGTSQHLVFLHV